MVPIGGDLYGGGKFAKNVLAVNKKLDKLEKKAKDKLKKLKKGKKGKTKVKNGGGFHGNDRRNENPQHNYDILNADGQVVKNGVGTGDVLPENLTRT